MRVLVTGADGFIGKNLCTRLREIPDTTVVPFTRNNQNSDLRMLVTQADAVVHLAGVNRPTNTDEFTSGNVQLTQDLCAALASLPKAIPFILASSTQAELDNPYGHSKRAAEDIVKLWVQTNKGNARIYRLPGVFGKWARPNYNSVVATFCHNISRDLPIKINDANTHLTLVYIDDVIDAFIKDLTHSFDGLNNGYVTPEYTTTLGDLAEQIKNFATSRDSLTLSGVGDGLHRALYATYVSYLPVEKFSYPVPAYTDKRGEFVEMLKTEGSGQFSYFTAFPGVTRGEHYHHSKTEKFLVIRGHALFKFRHIITNESQELSTKGGSPQIVETIPGWSHNITNIGDEEMIVMIWANEIFDRSRPDTISCPV
jgi:UDP-2-acetamido-2,6-beta-L-arabino-hexul-4-ose reductase